MAFDVTASHFIWIVAFVAIVPTAALAFFEVLEDAEGGLEERHGVESERVLGRLDRAYFAYYSATGLLSVEARNEGRIELDASRVTVLLDGVPVTGFTAEIQGAPLSTRWLPNETAIFNVSGQGGLPTRVLLVTEHGLSRLTVSTVSFSYVDPAGVDITGGTVADADNMARVAGGDVATLTEVRNQSGLVRPAALNDREFTSSVAGWTKTDVSGTHTLSWLGTDGTPTANGSASVVRQSGGNGVVHLNHSWTQAAPDDNTGGTFRLDYKPANVPHANRHLKAYLAKPDGTSVLMAEVPTWTANAWSTMSGTVAASHLAQAGTYAIRIEVGAFQNGDEWRFDNVALNWTVTEPYRYAKYYEIRGVPDDPDATRLLEINGRASSGTEALQVWVADSAGAFTERTSLSATTMTLQSASLAASDVQADGTVKVRLVDAVRNLDAVQDAWELDFLRVRVEGS